MSGDDAPRLIYLLLLLLMVGGGVFSARRGLIGGKLKMLLAWAAIFTAVAFVHSWYNSSFYLFDPAVARLGEDGRSITLPRTRSGGFEAIATVNGTDVRFLIDTGATGVVLSQTDAVRVGIDLDSLVFDGLAATANGDVAIANVTLDTVDLAGIVDRKIRASVTAGELNFSLLGMSYLEVFERIEISGDELTLVR